MNKTRLKLGQVLIATLFIWLHGCAVTPEPYLVTGRYARVEIVETAHPCKSDLLAGRIAGPDAAGSSLDPGGFNLLSWNMLKGRKPGWSKDFFRLSQESDVILLQEAYLTEEMHSVLRSAQMNWNLATAFKYREVETGVLTASTSAPYAICLHRFSEPLLKIPKSILFTRFAMPARQAHIVIVNVHAVNFTLDTVSYRSFWQQLQKILASYRGPLIVAGDFNTWSS